MRGWLEALVLGASALVVYLSLGADAFYKVDGIDIVHLLHEHARHPWHPGFLPALAGFRSALGLFGIEPTMLQLGAWFSAFGAAVGVAFARRGMDLLGMTRGAACFATVAFAVSPGLLTFATTVEFHGPALAPLGLCFWWLAHQVRRPSPVGMALLGALCHLPFLLHSQQVMFPAWLLSFYLARRGLRLREVALAALAGVVHLALVLGLPQLFPDFYGHWSHLGVGLKAEASIGRPQSLDYTGEIFLQEWLWPQLPLSVFAFTSVLSRRLRAEFVAFLAGFMPYLYVSVRQLVHEPEYGAYMVPMLLPAAMLTARRLATRWVAWPLLLVGVYMWYRGPLEHLREQRRIDDVFAGEISAAAGDEEPFVLVGSHRELGSAYARLDPDDFLWVRANATLPRAKATPQHFAGMELYLKSLVARGRAVLMTKSAIDSLEDPRGAMLAEKATLEVPTNDEMAGPLFASDLREKFEFVPEGGGALWRLR